MPDAQLARRTDKFRNQHDLLVQIATGLDQRSKSIASEADAADARSIINNFGGKLMVHLAMEDKSLYPALLSSERADVVALTQQFIDEMGGLAQAFDAYTKKWSSPSTILEQSDEFAAETGGLVAALAERIDRENNELYPLADAS